MVGSLPKLQHLRTYVVDLPPAVDIQRVWEFHQAGVDEGRWDYEDAANQHTQKLVPP